MTQPHMADRIVGRIPVRECLKANRRKPRRLFLLRGAKGLDEIRHAARDIPIEECDRNRLDHLAKDQTHQGAILDADPLPIHNADEWANGQFPQEAVVLVLDSIEDPHNFGAIVRSAVAFGATAVVFGKDRSAPLSAATFKSGAGAFEYAELVQATNLARCLQNLKESGFWTAAFSEEATDDMWKADLKGRIALVIGSEGKGVRPLVQKHCDMNLRIPLPGPIGTLNASVSAAIALAECLRQRS